MLKCPNGTSSTSQSSNIYDCIISPGNPEVLKRVTAVPEWYWKNESKYGADFGGRSFTKFSDYQVHGVTFETNKYANKTDFDDVGDMDHEGNSIGTVSERTSGNG